MTETLSFLTPLLPPLMGEGAFLGVLLASFAGSFITVAFGIGGGGLLLAVFASLMPAAALIPVHGVVQLGSNAVRGVLLFRFISWPNLPAFAVGSIIGVGLGGSIVVELPPQAIQFGVGCFIIWTVLAKPPAWLSRWPLLTGGISSFLTMFFGATGLFVAAFTKSLKLDRHSHVATHAALMTVQHLLKVIVFGLLGFAFAPWAWAIVAMILCGAIGTLVGRLVLNRMSDHGFQRILNIILVLISLRLIFSAISESWPILSP